MENSVPFVLDRSALEACGACELSAFEKKSEGTHQIVYSDGWQGSDTARMARENPVGLLFLTMHSLIPVTGSAARAAIEKISGKSTLSTVMAEFARRGAGTKKPSPALPAEPLADTDPAVDVSPPARRRGR